MAGIDPNSLAILLWSAAVIIIGWTWLPAVISSLGGTRYKTGGGSNILSLEGHEREIDYLFWANQLVQLEYEPLSACWFRIQYAGTEWVTTIPVRVFFNLRKQSFAYVHQAPAPLWFWPGAIFVTIFSEGGMLTTDNNVDSQPDLDNLLVQQGMVTLDLRELEALHLATLQQLRTQGNHPDTDMSIESFLAAASTHFAPLAQRHYSRAATQYVFAHALIHVCVTIPAAYIAGIQHWTVPLSNVVLGLVLFLGESAQRRQYARAVRLAFREKQAQSEKIDEPFPKNQSY